MNSTPAADPAGEDTRGLRDQLSSLRGLLALSLVMTDRRSEDEIVLLTTTAVPALVPAQVAGVHLQDGQTSRWLATTRPLAHPTARRQAERDLRDAPANGGPVTLVDQPWGWGLPLRGLRGPIGALVLMAGAPMTSDQMLLLRSLAQQAGIALDNARKHTDLQQTNAELARTVQELRFKTAIHDRFTQVAISGTGRDGIVAALSELTGFPASIEDRAGEVLAWADPGSVPVPGWEPERARTRETVLEQASRSVHPVRAGDRLITVARPRADVIGVLTLVDPEQRAADREMVALEHAGTVLAIEMARLHSVAETELRLGGDLLAELLSGADADAGRRARALGHDLRGPHRVVLVTKSARSARESPTDLLPQLRTALGRALSGRPGPLPLMRQSARTAIVLLPDSPDSVDRLRRHLDETSAMAVGGVCTGPEEVPRSNREAVIADRFAQQRPGAALVRFDDLGVYRLFATMEDAGALDGFVREWLGALLDYDERRGLGLVDTLAQFLERGGNYDLTAAALSVGRSTLRYRLRRIAEVSGHDLGDPHTRFHLHLATTAWLARAGLDA